MRVLTDADLDGAFETMAELAWADYHALYPADQWDTFFSGP